MKFMMIYTSKSPSGIIEIHTNDCPRRKYVYGYTVKSAEKAYREEFDLQNKKFTKIYS